MQNLLDARTEESGIDGLAQETVEADFLGTAHIILHDVGGEGDDGDMGEGGVGV